mgnify:CR=1 FL=1
MGLKLPNITDCADNKKMVMVFGMVKLIVRQASESIETQQNELLSHTMLQILDIAPF